MKTLHISVVDKIATYHKRDGDIVCGNSNYELKFNFDSEWDAHVTKTARIIINGEYKDILFNGDTCPLPIIRNAIRIEVGVYAGDLKTTTPAVISCKHSILCGSTIPSPDVDPDEKLAGIELPQKWFEINEAYEAAGEGGHKLLGGILYKDFNGDIQVAPLSPAYGVRTDECGKTLAAVAMYNSAQQLLVKPATTGRHTVPLRQLDEFFGGGDTSKVGEDAFSLQKIPPVDLTPPINERKPYVFCRDSQNKFAPKHYSEPPFPDELAERDSAGRLRGNAPDSASNDYGYTDYLVNVDYLNRILNKKLLAYLPLSGGTMTGTPTIKKNSPALALQNTSDNTSAYVQLYKQRLRLGYTWTNALAVDKDGNVEVVGDLTVGGSISGKPATDGSHAITLRQLDEFFGGGLTSEVGESAFSLQKIPPVDLTPHVNARKCYVFCRDSENKFAPKYYGEPPSPDELAERDSGGRLRANAPDSEGAMSYDDYVVNVDYLNRRLANFSGGSGGGENTEAAEAAATRAEAAASNASGSADEANNAKVDAEAAAQRAEAAASNASNSVDEANNAKLAAEAAAQRAEAAAENAQTTINALKTETLILTYEDGSTRTLEVYVK